MKQIFILLFVSVIFYSTLAAEPIQKLKKGDWFIIEFANQLEDYSPPVNSADYCAPIDLRQLALRCEVLEKSHDVLILVFAFERMFYTSKMGEYSDSYFYDEDHLKQSTFKIGAKIDLTKDSVSYSLPTNTDRYGYSIFSRKVNIEAGSTSSTEYEAQIIYSEVKEMLNAFLTDWRNREYDIPIEGMGEINIERFNKFRILDASVHVNSNFSLEIYCDNSLEKDSFEIFASKNFGFSSENKGTILMTGRMKKGEGSAIMYLKEQKLLELHLGEHKVKFVATPGDHIILDLTHEKPLETLKSKFSGDQKYNVELTDEKNRFYMNPGILKTTNSVDSVFIGITEELEKKISLLDAYKNEMTTNWYRKQLKEINYWAAECVVSWYEKHLLQANFSKLSKLDAFKNIQPLFDYYLCLEHYDSYIGAVTRNSFRPSIESISTNQGFSRNFNSVENYEICNALYWGYPKYYALRNMVMEDLQFGGYESAQKNYDNFIDACKYPKFIHEVKTLYSEVGRTEPGKPILDLNLKFLQNSNFQKENKKYKIVNFVCSDFDVDFDRLRKVIEGVSKVANLQNKIELYIVCPHDLSEKVRLKMPKSDFFETKIIELNSREIIHQDLLLLHAIFFRILILSPDNTIINRSDGLHHIHQNIMQFIHSQNQPTSQKGNSRLLLVILASLINFGLLSWFVIRIRTKQIAKKEAAKRKLSELELRAIRSQMNPHFIFNSLNSIQNLVNKNKIEETNIYLSEFAEMMRLVLNNSEKKLVPLEEELQLIQSYLELEKLRIPFEFEIVIDPTINPSEEEIPGMLIQPFVENAVVHGVAPQKGGFVKVSLTKNKGKVICEISDNGIGISKRSEQRKGNGKAIKMVHERINIVNSQASEPLTLEIIDRKNLGEKGTLVKIEIPV
jgi:two-component sensor histidine kinase